MFSTRMPLPFRSSTVGGLTFRVCYHLLSSRPEGVARSCPAGCSRREQAAGPVSAKKKVPGPPEGNPRTAPCFFVLCQEPRSFLATATGSILRAGLLTPGSSYSLRLPTCLKGQAVAPCRFRPRLQRRDRAGLLSGDRLPYYARSGTHRKCSIVLMHSIVSRGPGRVNQKTGRGVLAFYFHILFAGKKKHEFFFTIRIPVL